MIDKMIAVMYRPQRKVSERLPDSLERIPVYSVPEPAYLAIMELTREQIVRHLREKALYLVNSPWSPWINMVADMIEMMKLEIKP